MRPCDVIYYYINPKTASLIFENYILKVADQKENNQFILNWVKITVFIYYFGHIRPENEMRHSSGSQHRLLVRFHIFKVFPSDTHSEYNYESRIKQQKI